ncbi:MAG: cytochrome c3 family protein [Raoultibacter sp.]
MMEKKEGVVSRSAKARVLLAVVAAMAVLTLALAACAPGGAKTDAAGDKGVDWDAVIAENPDDLFVASYASGDSNCLITTHQKLGYTCADCHDDSAAQLVGTIKEPLESSESDVGTRELCLNDACHGNEWDKIKESTIMDGESTVYNRDAKYNVHDNHRGDVDCGECHSMHETSTLNCVECHNLGELPEGWDGYE